MNTFAVLVAANHQWPTTKKKSYHFLPKVELSLDFGMLSKKAVTELLILRLLRDSDMYAYEMQREIERKSAGVLSFNTLYLAIYRLKDYGFIEERRKEIVDGRERVYFGITENERHRLDELSDEYLRLVVAMEKMMFSSKPSE